MGILEKAISFAAEKHIGAVRKGSDIPYIAHPLEALSIAASITSDHDILAVAVLHDVVEDTSAELKDIEREFGKRIAELVASESEDKMLGVPPSESWKLRKEATIRALQTASLDEKIIVLSDKLSNIRAIYRDFICDGDAVWKKFNQKDKQMHEWYYRAIAEAISDLSEHIAYQEFYRLIDMVFIDENYSSERNYKLLLVEELAETGNKDAMFDVACHYHNLLETHISISDEKCKLIVRYLEELAEENKDAALLLGTMYYVGKGVEQSYGEAVKWYQMAADKMDSWGLCNLGYCYYYGRDVKIDYAKAYYYFSQSAYLKNPNAAYKLGDMFFYGYHVQEDKNAAFFWYQEAKYQCKNGVEKPNINYRLGLCYLHGYGTYKNLTTALRLFQDAELEFLAQIEYGDPFAELTLEKVKEEIETARAMLYKK